VGSRGKVMTFGSEQTLSRGETALMKTRVLVTKGESRTLPSDLSLI
jgi:hypothetical protein